MQERECGGMKGLVIKDIYVLKKNIPVFVSVTVGVMVLGVLFVLSAKYGNIAEGLKEMRQEPMGEETFFAAYQMAVWAVLILPLTFLTIAVECFKADGRNGFYKVEKSLPVPYWEVVAARYISSMILSGICLLASLCSGYMVSLATEVYTYQQIAQYTLSIFGLLFLYNMMVFPLYYYFGEKRADMILGLPLLLAYFISIFCFYRIASTTSGVEEMIFEFLDRIKRVFLDYSFMLVGIAFVVGFISFAVACRIQKRKGGENR